MRRAKTDKKDAIKPANDGLGHWLTLARYRYPIDAQKLLPGNTSRIQKLKNNLISLLDTAFPGANRLFSSPPRTDGSEKWWTSQRHFGTVSAFAFYVKKHLFPNTKGGVRNIAITSAKIGHWIFMLLPVVTLMLCRKLILPDFWQNRLSLNPGRPETAKLQKRALAASLPEYPVVMKIFGVGPSLGSQLMAEIGDVRRFRSKTASVAFAGIDASPYQSGQIDIYIRNSASLQNFSC